MAGSYEDVTGIQLSLQERLAAAAGSLARHAIAGAGFILVTKGLVTQDIVDQAVNAAGNYATGGALIVIGAGYGFLRNIFAQRLLKIK